MTVAIASAEFDDEGQDTGQIPLAEPSNLIRLRGCGPDLSAMSDEELVIRFESILEETAEKLNEAGRIIREMESRGIKILANRPGIPFYYRDIADGKLSGEAVIGFAENYDLFRAVSSLPIPEQKRLARGDYVEFVLRSEAAEDGYDTKMKDPLEMRAEEIRQVFDRGKIRTRAEQITYLIERSPRPASWAAGAPAKRTPAIAVNPKNHTLVIGTKEVTPAEVLDAVRRISDDSHEPPRGDQRRVRMSVTLDLFEDEKQAFEVNAARAGRDPKWLVYQAVKAAGLLKETRPKRTNPGDQPRAS